MRKITVGYNQENFVTGFKLFDVTNTCILRIGRFEWETKEINLEAEDRIVGFRSKLHGAAIACHYSLVIVIARRTV